MESLLESQTKDSPKKKVMNVIDNRFLDTFQEQVENNQAVDNTQQLFLIILNMPINKELFQKLIRINQEPIILCADGGANRLYDYDQNHIYIPHAIIGDLDSIRENVKNFYESQGTLIIDKSDDQDSTDLQKCLVYAENQRKHNSLSLETSCIKIVIGAFGGRLDQTMLNMSILFTQMYDQSCPLYLCDEHTLAFKVPKGDTKILFSDKFESKQGIGLIPSQLTKIQSTGLKWDLGEEPFDKISMDLHISSSNARKGNEVEVTCDRDIIFTSTIKDS